MADSPHLSLAEIDRRIAIARDNIRQLIEQAAAFSGAKDEDRNADRSRGAGKTDQATRRVAKELALQKPVAIAAHISPVPAERRGRADEGHRANISQGGNQHALLYVA